MNPFERQGQEELCPNCGEAVDKYYCCKEEYGPNVPIDTSPCTFSHWERCKWNEEKEGGRIYPCANCGKLRTKDEGGTVFTVCDECWDKHWQPKEPVYEYKWNYFGKHTQEWLLAVGWYSTEEEVKETHNSATDFERIEKSKRERK